MAKAATTKARARKPTTKKPAPKKAAAKPAAPKKATTKRGKQAEPKKATPEAAPAAAAEKPAAKAKKPTPAPKGPPQPTIEHVYFRSDSAYLCLLLNRRNKFIRVIDFRAGALPAKRLFIQSVAKKEDVVKVITLVEKDEVSSWTRVGFVREGTIPGFYKRSDGHLCGCVIGERTASVEVSESDMKLAEKTVANAKKGSREVPETIRGASIREVEDTVALAARDAAFKKGLAVNTFDEFGRDAERLYFETTYKKSKGNYISVEFQDCFGHSLVEVLRSPADENELFAVVAALRNIGEDLKERGIVSAFAFAPTDDHELGTAFSAAGYRRTGLLAQALLVGDERKDAILWTRKLANPAGEEE